MTDIPCDWYIYLLDLTCKYGILRLVSISTKNLQPTMHGIFAYMYHKNQPNVGRYTSPMDPMGYDYDLVFLNLVTYRNVQLMIFVRK